MTTTRARCATYLRRAGRLTAARRLAKAEGFTASRRDWTRALLEIIGQEI